MNVYVDSWYILTWILDNAVRVFQILKSCFELNFCWKKKQTKKIVLQVFRQT